jgi:hypothetical protein
MKCKAVQHRLLAITNPERLPSGLRNHLAHCSLCREWHNHLILLEWHISLLPIPQSNGKAKLIRRLLQEKVPGAQAARPSPETRSQAPTLSHTRALTLPHRRVPIPPLPFPRPPVRRRKLLLGAAAAVLLIALGWFGLHG